MSDDLHNNSKGEAKWLHDLKYLAVLSLFVTFLVFFVTSIYTDSSRIIAMYEKDDYSSLCMHFISPTLSLAEFFHLYIGLFLK